MSAVEAEYADGYIHSEIDLDDVSPYEPTRNVLNDIIEHRPEAEHGPMVRFSVLLTERVDIDWTLTPPGARPIRFRTYEVDQNGPDAGVQRLTRVDFGYQWTENGKNHQDVRSFT